MEINHICVYKCQLTFSDIKFLRMKNNEITSEIILFYSAIFLTYTFIFLNIFGSLFILMLLTRKNNIIKYHKTSKYNGSKEKSI